MIRRWLCLLPAVAVLGSLASPAHGATPRRLSMSDRSSACASRSSVPASAGLQHLAAGGVSGTYLLAAPRDERRRHPARLLLAFYGFASDPGSFARLTQLLAIGPREDEVVVIVHDQPGEVEFQLGRTSTDATFVSSVIQAVEHKECVLTHQLTAVGFSDGAAFSILYACDHEGEFTRLATVAVEFQLGCTTPISVLAFHGTADQAVPYQDGAIGSSLPGLKVRGTQKNMDDWARLDHCRPGSIMRREGTQVVAQRWSRCAPGTSVELFSILGGGHTWPGGGVQPGGGLATSEISASRLIARFASGATLGS